jgi:cellobiose phosphorylase
MILGIQRRGDVLTVDPVMPPDWTGFRIRYRDGSIIYDIEVEADPSFDKPRLWLNGQRLNDNTVPLKARR